MKKLGLLVMPLMAISLLASCNKGGGGGGGDGPEPTEYTITYKNVSAEETSSFIKTYASEDLPITLSAPSRTDWIFDGWYTERTFENEVKTILKGTTGNITLYAKMILNKTLEEASWDEIALASKTGTARDSFGDPGTQTKKVQLRHQDTNGDGADIISDGELYQTVRIIGYNEDYTELPKGGGTPDPNKAIGITFEFVDLISDECGYSLATYWNDVSSVVGSEYNYKESTIRKALNGGDGDINWFRFYGLPSGEEDPRNLEFATEPNYKKSVLDMLPESLTKEGILKTPAKYININEGSGWEEQTVKDKLFLLSPAEIGRIGHDEEEEHTTTYSYYENVESIISKRNKRQIKGAEEARTNSLSSSDLAGELKNPIPKFSFAGYDCYGGGYFYLRSPNVPSFVYDSYSAWQVSATDGGSRIDFLYLAPNGALAVAPAFCI